MLDRVKPEAHQNQTWRQLARVWLRPSGLRTWWWRHRNPHQTMPNVRFRWHNLFRRTPPSTGDVAEPDPTLTLLRAGTFDHDHHTCLICNHHDPTGVSLTIRMTGPQTASTRCLNCDALEPS